MKKEISIVDLVNHTLKINYNSRFVFVNLKTGRIGYTAGKPDEIRYLYKKCVESKLELEDEVYRALDMEKPKRDKEKYGRMKITASICNDDDDFNTGVHPDFNIILENNKNKIEMYIQPDYNENGDIRRINGPDAVDDAWLLDETYPENAIYYTRIINAMKRALKEFRKNRKQ